MWQHDVDGTRSNVPEPETGDQGVQEAIRIRKRLIPLRSSVVAAIVFHVVLSFTSLNAADTIPIWHLTRGQKFSVQATTHRITEIQVGEHHSVSDVTDRITLQYTMFDYDRRGFAQLGVRIKSLDRTTINESGEKTTKVLPVEKTFKVPAAVVLVGDHGNDVKVLGVESVFRADFPQAHRIFAEICGDDVFQSWFDLPFHVPLKTARSPTLVQPADKSVSPEKTKADSESFLHTDHTWTRAQHISLGLPGTVQCDWVYLIGTIEEFEAQLSVSGALRMVLQESNEEVPLRFEDFQLTMSDVSGAGKILMDELSGLPQSIQLTQKLLLEGQSAVASGGTSYEFRFKQSLTQTSIASEFGMLELQQDGPVSPLPFRQ